MSNISNGGPRYILNGIRDESVKAPVPVPEVFPQHVPHVYILAERGELTPTLVEDTMLTQLYGAKSFSNMSKYYTMGTAYANVFARAANMMYVQRVHPKDALKPSMFTLGIEIVQDTVADVERDVDGNVVRKPNGEIVYLATSRPGHVGRLVINRDVKRRVGEGKKTKGELVSSEGLQSDFYPIMDLEVPTPGAYGDNVGISLWAPNTLSADPLNTAVARDQLAQLYRLRFFERRDAQTTPVVKLTAGSSAEINFSFRRDVIDRGTELKYDIKQRIKEYGNSGDDGTIPFPGPMTNCHIYSQYIEDFLKIIFDLERSQNDKLLDGPGQEHQMNFLGGVDFDANPYYTFRLQGVADGGVNMNDAAIYYASGGSDGEMSEEIFDELVREQFENYGDLPGIQMLDDAAYPVSAYYDANYSIETKKAMISLLGKRKDIMIYGSCTLPGRVRLNAEEQRSLGTSLRAFALLFPESTMFATPTCRYVAFMQSGRLAGDDSDEYMPHLLDHAYKRAKYAGSADGVLKNEFAYDAPINNEVQLLRDLDILWERDNVRNKNWSGGLNYAMTMDSRRRAYVPHVQTCYEYEASVIRDEIPVTICVDIEKQCQRAYKMLGVDGRRTNQQNLQRLTKILEDLTKDKYDSRCTIKVRTFRTVSDVNSRVRYSCEIDVWFNKAMYIGSFTVVSRNLEDLV